MYTWGLSFHAVKETPVGGLGVAVAAALLCFFVLSFALAACWATSMAAQVRCCPSPSGRDTTQA